MLPVEYPEYNPKFPEKFNWDTLDSIKMARLALLISKHIEFDLKKKETELSRIYIPGMRRVLHMIATTEPLS